MRFSSRSFVSSLGWAMRALGVGSIGVALAGCSLFDDSSSDTAETATLDAVPPSTETGTVTLTDTGSGTTQVAITTAGGDDTGAQSAVMRTGVCGSDGDVFAILNNVQARASITTIAYDLASLTGGKYYIDIHSSTDVTTVVACGQVP
ncbi:Hypothetical protein A7982_08699 [Minicystis rosea]|nr:Hypothetical protein A7982_08699 [Minicystis rosea]